MSVTIEQQPVRGEQREKHPASHVHSFEPGKALCGVPMNPTVVVFFRVEERANPCVVCLSIWNGMSRQRQRALHQFWE